MLFFFKYFFSCYSFLINWIVHYDDKKDQCILKFRRKFNFFFLSRSTKLIYSTLFTTAAVIFGILVGY